MRRSTRIAILSTVLIIIAFVVITPAILGMYFARTYPSLLTLYKSYGLNVQTVHYSRGWFSSNATLLVEVDNPSYEKFFNQFGIADNFIPKKFEITQHIEHGPILYQSIGGLHSIFGIASIHNSLVMNKNIKNFYHILGVNDKFIEAANQYFSFRGHQYSQFKLGELKIHFPRAQINMSGLESDVWIFHENERFKGKLIFKNLTLEEPEGILSIPTLIFKFDQHNGGYHFLLGKNSLHIPEIQWREQTGMIVISDVHFDGFLNDSKGLLDASRAFDIKKIDIDHQTFGPLHLAFSVNHINSKALLDMIGAIREIEERGELYRSQLQQKVMMLLPGIINSGTRITLNGLNIATSDGKLEVSGEAAWLNNTLPEDIAELIQTADAHLDLRISRGLLNKWIAIASTLPYFNQGSGNTTEGYSNARDNHDLATRFNAVLLTALTDEGALTDQDAFRLLELQKNMASLDSYKKEITKLYLNKNITRETSYQLFSAYLEVERPLIAIVNDIQSNQTVISQSMRKQWDDWIQEGYIKEDKEDYLISIIQQKGTIKISDKAIN